MSRYLCGIFSDILIFKFCGCYAETEIVEAVAIYDFEGRSSQELSFKKDDVLILYSKRYPDWWDGAHNGKEGLIPDKYIRLKR